MNSRPVCPYCGAKEGGMHEDGCQAVQPICVDCDPTLNYPGRTIATDKDGKCSKCGRRVMESVTEGVIPTIMALRRWDRYFHDLCITVASKSSCLSRQIGAILVKDNIVVATGFCGPARGIPHCGHERFMKDDHLPRLFKEANLAPTPGQIKEVCPRKLLGYASGEGLEWCISEHAERNCIASAARVGVSVRDTILYMNCVIPCKNCLNLLINAGVKEVVVDDDTPYDKHSGLILRHTTIKIRKFEL